MILQALVDHYNALNAKGEISPPGWAKPPISYALRLSPSGEVENVEMVLVQVEEGKGNKKKTVWRPRRDILLPAGVKRSSGARAIFLWDNAAYMLGLADGGDKTHVRDCFLAAKELHHKVLDNVDSPAARAIISYFDKWDPSLVGSCEPVHEKLEKLINGCNITFLVDGQFACEYPEIRKAWQKYYDARSGGVLQQSLVSGNVCETESVHLPIKGVRGAMASGAALVSFNVESFCSYGKSQGYNAPVGKTEVFAYTTALNHLLGSHNCTQYIGDTTITCWADTAEEQYPSIFSALMGNSDGSWSEKDLYTALRRLSEGLPCEELKLDPNRTFYILGLAPNSSRLSVCFFLKNSFGDLMKNVNAHYKRLEIQRPTYDKSGFLPLWKLLAETVNQNSRDKKPSPVMANATAQAIWHGDRYPAALLYGVVLRIRADNDVNWRRAAIIKAYYLKNTDDNCPKEVLTVGLNETSTNIPYTLGRLFSLYEAVQQAANPGINKTIKDTYFNSAASAPASIFPILCKLCQIHLRKLQPGQRIYYDKQISELNNILGETYPARLYLPQQGSFDLGYYHQTQKRFTKKEDK